MTKILLVSDNHANTYNLDKVYNENHNQVDLCVHCGDSCQYVEEIEDRFIAVRGNNDDFTFDNERILIIENHHILITHGTGLVDYSNNKRLVKYAKEKQCDVVFFGHTHIPYFHTLNGVTCINPGSLNYNRDGSMPSYAIVDISENNIEANFYTVN